MTKEKAQKSLKYLRGEIKKEQISMSELAELQDLVEYIKPGDVELLEWAGVPEETYRNNLLKLRVMPEDIKACHLTPEGTSQELDEAWKKSKKED